MTQLPPQQPDGPYPPPGGGYPPPPPVPGGPAYLDQPAWTQAAQPYTSWIARVGATIVDGIPGMVIGGIGVGIAVATGTNACVADTEGYGGSCTSSFSGVGIATTFLASLLVLVYSIWNWGYRQGTTGSTIGKSAFKFKVISEATGQPIGFVMSIVRQFAHLVDGAICYIGYLFPLWDAKRQTLADKIMSTVCVPIR
ncbi:RDD family protein [Mycobacterium cookii]|uniref:RDD family protein n=1 Tax=Mycobacterium cookii TaxID=1775 RepID=A0A7I7KRU6_9MYCO|nr:RDD family protein [Mycobacterium cookii]MCV7332420.1 RDD family protein [Mycobacterium cookii]BBX44446.1 RDD family protein [Mycobacterium cookii]